MRRQQRAVIQAESCSKPGWFLGTNAGWHYLNFDNNSTRIQQAGQQPVPIGSRSSSGPRLFRRDDGLPLDWDSGPILEPAGPVIGLEVDGRAVKPGPLARPAGEVRPVAPPIAAAHWAGLFTKLHPVTRPPAVRPCRTGGPGGRPSIGTVPRAPGEARAGSYATSSPGSP